jgi:hypothetical protein
MSELDTAMLMNSMDRMRARCTTPRDVVAVYQALNKVRKEGAPLPRLQTACGDTQPCSPPRLACNTDRRSACSRTCTCLTLSRTEPHREGQPRRLEQRAFFADTLVCVIYIR